LVAAGHSRSPERCATAARNVLAKIGAVLPDDLKNSIDASGLLIGPGEPIAAGDAELAAIREAIGRSARRRSSIPTSMPARPGGPSGPLRSPFMIACVSSSRGANCANAIAISEPIASPRWM
jgi:hypothetical protein